MTVSVGTCTLGTINEGTKCPADCDSTLNSNPIDHTTVCNTAGDCLDCLNDNTWLSGVRCADCHETCTDGCTDGTECPVGDTCSWSCDGTPDKNHLDDSSICSEDGYCDVCTLPMTYLEDSGVDNSCRACPEFCIDCSGSDSCTTWAEGHYDSNFSKNILLLLTYSH